MRFIEALWDEDHAQLLFKTDIISPLTGQPYVMSITGVGNWDEAQRVFQEVKIAEAQALMWASESSEDSLTLERLPSRYGLLKSNGPAHGENRPLTALELSKKSRPVSPDEEPTKPTHQTR